MQSVVKIRNLIISMKIKQIFSIIGASLGVAALLSFATPTLTQDSFAKTCGGAETSIIGCEDNKNDGTVQGTGIWSLLLMAINILTAGVGIAALGGIVYGAVLYTSAGGNPEQVKKAKNMFVNVAIGVIAFGSMFFLLNFLIPGGVIG